MVDVGNGIAGGSPSNPVAFANYKYKTGANHAAFPFRSKSTGKFYVILGDEIFPDGVDFFAANETTGFLHFVDFEVLRSAPFRNALDPPPLGYETGGGPARFFLFAIINVLFEAL